MKKVIQKKTHSQVAEDDREYWMAQTPEVRLNAVEELRLEAGKFLYAYPARFQRTFRVTRRPSR